MWFIFAFLNSWIYAIYYLCNQNSKLTPQQFIIYRGFIAAFAATPFMLLYPSVFPLMFYIIVLFQGIIISYMDRKYFEAFRRFGAENVNAIRPLTVAITFISWLLIDPTVFFAYLETPYRTSIISLSIMVIIISVIKYRGHAVGLSCFQKVFPLLLLSSLVDMSNKLIMDYTNGHLYIAAIYRVGLTGWIIGFINLFTNCKNKTDYIQIFKLKNLVKGLFILWLVLSMVILNLAMFYTSHPAYCSAVFYLSVVWIVLINKINNLRGKVGPYQSLDKKWIFSLLFATIILVLITG